MYKPTSILGGKMAENDVFKDINVILEYAHFWNWAPDWAVLRDVYKCHPDSYSILTPFAYAFLEELIRSRTSEYGMDVTDNEGNPKRRKVGRGLINLAMTENGKDKPFLEALEEIKDYFGDATPFDRGNNRNSVDHGFMHPRYWTKESFEQLVHDIAVLSKYSRF